MKIWHTAAFVLGVGIVGAQAPPPATFDVASVRKAAPPTPDSIRGGQFRAGTNIGKDNAAFDFVTLADLIPYAYGVKPFQVVGPALNESRWNIQAKFAEGSADRVPEMLQALLTERFKLSIHREKREQPVYELVVAKGGPKMEVVEAVEAAAEAPAAPGLPGPFGRLGGPPFAGPPGGGPPEGGLGRGPGRGPGGAGPQGGGRGGGRALALAGASGGARITPSPENCGMQLEFDKLTMASLAETLTPFLDRPVLDSTELKGSYKAALKLPIEAMLLMAQNQIRGSGLEAPAAGRGGFAGGRAGGGGGDAAGRGGPGGPAGPLAGCDVAGAQAGGDTNSSNAIFQAVQQLGLRLQAKKAPFDTIVVDRVEKEPTEN